MASRRDLLLGGVGLASALCRPAWSATAGAPGIPSAIKQFEGSAAQHIQYSTVRLEFRSPNELRWGTSFFFDFFSQNGKAVTALVTNRHVFADSTSCQIHFHAAGPDGLPIAGRSIPIEITDLQRRILPHPNCDLAILPIGPEINLAEERHSPFFRVPLSPGLIPDAVTVAALDAVEDVMTAGYPGMLWDDVNNLPLFHRGTTATPINVDFKGAPNFLVDFATIGGASGSPMFVYNENGFVDERTHSTMLGAQRLLFVGVVSAVAIQEADGQVFLVNAPLGTASPTPLIAKTAVPANLGVCIQAQKILDFEPLIARMGFPVPPGYVMRAATH